MPKYITLSQSEETAKALAETIRLAGPAFMSLEPSQQVCEAASIVWKDNDVGLEAYRTLTGRLEELSQGNSRSIPRREVIVVVDQISFDDLNPIGSSGWSSVIAMLILTFPEFRWVFGLIRGGSGSSFAETHSLSTLSNSQSEPLFDGTGLREHVRSKARNCPENQKLADYLPKRTNVAVTIDDEESYAYFHAYAAYRFGYRSQPIISERLAFEFFGSESLPAVINFHGPVALTIEDYYLNFADHDNNRVGKDLHLSSLTDRCALLPGLDRENTGVPKRPSRVFVTAGLERRGDEDKWKANEGVSAELKNQSRLGTRVFKPVAGVYGFWKEAGLMASGLGHNENGYASDYDLAPSESDGQSSSGHSAPGKLLEIASRLINRAQQIVDTSRTVEDSVHGAVLATDALELLGNRTPTTALEALSLKCSLEVKASCQFHGVQFHISTQPLLEDLQLRVAHISKWFNGSRRRNAELNAEIRIVTDLAGIFRENAQFDEEHQCLNRIRELQRKIWFRKNPAYYPFYPLAFYVDFLLSSIPKFATMLIVWVLGLACLYALTSNGDLMTGFYGGLKYSVSSFFAVQPPIDTAMAIRNVGPWRGWGVITLAITSGFLHLGIFISHLYSIVVRR